MRLWDWAVEAYARPGVAEAALSLQDEHGQSVAYLLWAVWAGGATPQDLTKGARAARSWETAALQPLRRTRRALKSDLPPIDAAARLTLREQVKVVELQAERVLLEALEALVSGPGGRAPPLAALTAAAEAWGDPPPAAGLARLAAALS
ncbi:MAG: TIGR02444 family protein [Phenylobacterium sp.]|uniref:TIGR02444 family protein n=1 Tax=Phenylobacterium sp. TaxID=1871053 RepID=UPI00391D5742